MRNDQFNGDDPQHIRPEWRAGLGNDGPYLLRVELTAALASGASATAKIVDYTGATWVRSDRVITVWDALRLKTGASGDKFWALWNVDSQRWEVLGDSGEKINFKNNAASEAPIYGNMEISGVETVDGVKYITVIKPSGTAAGPHYAFLVNSGAAVAAGATGVGYLAYEIPRRVKYKTSDGTPAFGEIWGNYNTNEWEVRKASPGYLVLGDVADGSFLGLKDVEVRAMASFYKTGGTTVTGLTSSPVPMTTSSSQLNVGMDFSPDYKLTIKITGTYLVTATLMVRANYAAGPKDNPHTMNVLKNGGAMGGGQFTSTVTTYEVMWATLAVTGHVYLEAGDYLQMSYGRDDATDTATQTVAVLSIVRLF